MIDSLRIQNFTVFKETKIDFCKGINVIIGQNGTGKTHLLKLLYTFYGGQKNYLEQLNNVFLLKNYYSQLEVSTVARSKSVEFFFELFNFSSILDDENKSEKTALHAYTPDVLKKKMREEHCDKVPKIELCLEQKANQDILFIPAKEMLTHATSLLALDRERTIPFDKTLIDIIAKAELGESKQNSPLENKLLEKISKIIEGTVLFENDTFFLLKATGKKIPFIMEADGHKKFGLLWKLIRNGLIHKDSVLLWDEPEANINPELIPVIVDVLLEMQRNGVQIFVATHSYNFAKYFEIREKKTDRVVFHSLYKTEQGTQIETQEEFGVLERNSIIQSYIQLYDDDIQKGL